MKEELKVTLTASPNAFTAYVSKTGKKWVGVRNRQTGNYAFTTRKGAINAVKRAFAHDFSLTFTN